MTSLSLDVLYRDHGAQRGLKNLGDTTARTSHHFRGLKVAGAAALAAVGVAAVKFGSDSVRAYVDAEASQVKLQTAFQKFPKLADTNIGALQKLNTELARKTRFDDDATASGQAVLAQFNLTGTQITRLTPLLQDYAARTGKDLPTAARDLGKAVLGQGRALKNVGINFKDTGSAAGNLEAITKGLRTQVGGFAEREGKTAAGQAEILRNQFGELQEAAGQRLLPALLKIGSGLLKVVTAVQDSSGVFGSFKRIVSATFEGFSGSVGGAKGAFRAFSDYIETHQTGIVTAFVEGGKAAIGMARGILGAASGGLRAMGTLDAGVSKVIIGIVRHFGSVVHGAALAFRWIPGLGPKLRAADRDFEAFSSGVITKLEQNGKGAIRAADTIDRRYLPALNAADRRLKSVGEREIWRAKQADAANRAKQAINAIGTAANGSQIRLRSWNERTKLGADAQRALEGRIRAARQRMLEQRDAGIRAGASQADLTRRWNQGRAALVQEFRQMGLSSRAARELANRYARIPKHVRTPITQPGMDPALDKTRSLGRRIGDIHGKRVTVDVHFTSNSTSVASRMAANVKSYAVMIKKNTWTGGVIGFGSQGMHIRRADGGVMPGYTPGRDVHSFYSPTAGQLDLSGGEAVMRPEWTRAVGGPAAVSKMNAAARRGQLSRERAAFAAGGTVRLNVASNGTPSFGGIDRASSSFRTLATAWGAAMARVVTGSMNKLAKTFADSSGGPIGGKGFVNALRWARGQVGKPYIWTGVGPGGYDCSGFMSAIINVIKGRSPYHRLFSTGMAGGAHLAGMTKGKSSPFRIGVWKNNPGHTAGTLNGVNVESAGGVGVRVGGRARGANNGLFTMHYGLARGGVIGGDVPFDTTHPHGERYNPEIEKLWKMLLGPHGLHTGGVVSRPSLTTLAERGPERVLSAPQTRSFERMVSAMDRGRGVGGNTYHVTINAPNYVGSKQELRDTIVGMARKGQLDVIKR